MCEGERRMEGKTMRKRGGKEGHYLLVGGMEEKGGGRGRGRGKGRGEVTLSRLKFRDSIEMQMAMSSS